ncbi:glycosyltransferase family 9 protein [Hippea jasoniae]|uniref:glycosyltransferase family 9 protein n=1 Tax=Hippea jasoniae TaxID=944479 RepID=UPI00055162F1|nr:glycosyltransferase family 9 protein [Hippea jasoniae]
MKILIIELGYSETLDKEVSKVVSLGDVIRTTPILEALKEKYKNSKIIFLTHEKSAELVEGNPYIDKLIIWDEFVGFLLLRERFDIVINLEKHPGICALADMIDAWRKFGFRLGNDFEITEYEKKVSFMDYINNKSAKKDYWQKILIEHLGLEWKKQRYSLGYKPKTKEVFDVGLNYKVGLKWPTKAMSKEKWNELYDKLTKLGYRVDWQKGLNNLKEYIDWINQSKLIVTQDSLGLHLAMALNKRVIGLFGPTDYSEIYPYGDVKFLTPKSSCPKMPCYKAVCEYEKFCMDEFDIDDLIEEIKGMI